MFDFSSDRRFADDRSSTLFYIGLERFFALTMRSGKIVDVKVSILVSHCFVFSFLKYLTIVLGTGIDASAFKRID